MSEKILVPALGESITEATVSKWLKKVGDPVEADEAIVELETDKVNLEVPSPLSGILSVSISTKGSSASKLSPIFLSHFETVASVIDSPSVGTINLVLIS